MFKMNSPTAKVISFFLLITLVLGVLPLSMGDGSSPSPSDERRSRGTIIVNASGEGDYTHIQWAVDNASDGDTIYVEAGAYYENVLINKTLNLTGAGSENTTIDGRGIQDVLEITANWVNVSGFSIINRGSWNAGIKVFNAQHGRIENNNCSRNLNGIFLESSNNIIISNNRAFFNFYYGIYLLNSVSNIINNNTCAFDGNGIFLQTSDNNLISNNTIQFNNYSGIYIYDSDSNTIENNICNSNENGIDIYYNSIANTVNDNNCSENVYNYYFFEPYMNFLEMTDNYANGIPILYLINASNLIIEEPVSMIILIDCDNVTVEGLSFQNNVYGIYSYRGKDNRFLNNSILGTSTGIKLRDSGKNIIENNTCLYNGAGINLGTSINNTVINNTSNSNKYHGIGFSVDSNNNTLINNTFNYNRYEGIAFYESDNNAITNNVCSDNGIGVNLEYSDQNLLLNNTFTKNQYGIYFWGSSNNKISNNRIGYNDWWGIYFEEFLDYYCDNNIIFNNTCYSNGREGIFYFPLQQLQFHNK